ncbi:hypothetical protein KIH39_03220 [Telmatocola sphagniphila]|uniref:Uncharacterized protein n=1 Tax=Telmatocola sphagniphila TaxID=1123043 RepID=A0A8E6B7T6_9BACT|nr:hypothetical protein [Telmatocola sphagniphila]QVL32942.1 hypothetical protein KIH39_03220 [Telmatocola sphagniphila]
MINSREIAGWILVGLGIAIFGFAFVMLLTSRWIVESGPIIFSGFIVFRGGIHLLKVALAARICQPIEAVKTMPSRKRL